MSPKEVDRDSLDSQTKARSESEPEDLHEAAFQGFLHLAELWDLTPEEGGQVLGLGEPSALEAWRAHPQWAPGAEVLIRVGHLLAVHRALTTLIPDQQVRAWLRRPNGEPHFQGRSPLSMLSSSHLQDLEAVHRVLNGRLNVW